MNTPLQPRGGRQRQQIINDKIAIEAVNTTQHF
jgi:hypothetical protein